jgi:hypothetical protein
MIDLEAELKRFLEIAEFAIDTELQHGEHDDQAVNRFVEEWLRAREIDPVELVSTLVSVEQIVMRSCLAQGDFLAIPRTLTCTVFQLGFEVAAKQYLGEAP